MSLAFMHTLAHVDPDPRAQTRKGSPPCPLLHHRQRLSRDEPLTYQSFHGPKVPNENQSYKTVLMLNQSPELFTLCPGLQVSSVQNKAGAHYLLGLGLSSAAALFVLCRHSDVLDWALFPCPIFRALEKLKRQS